MEYTLYNKSGEAIAYTTENMEIYSFSGKILAYIEGDSIYSFSGKHLGWFLNNWVIDNNGYYVFFTEYSIGGPSRPYKQFKPFKGYKEYKPYKGFKEYKPIKPLIHLSWSNLSEKQFFIINE